MHAHLTDVIRDAYWNTIFQNCTWQENNYWNASFASVGHSMPSAANYCILTKIHWPMCLYPNLALWWQLELEWVCKMAEGEEVLTFQETEEQMPKPWSTVTMGVVWRTGSLWTHQSITVHDKSEPLLNIMAASVMVLRIVVRALFDAMTACNSLFNRKSCLQRPLNTDNWWRLSFTCC